MISQFKFLVKNLPIINLVSLQKFNPVLSNMHAEFSQPPCLRQGLTLSCPKGRTLGR